jgi:hypothetical protein
MNSETSLQARAQALRSFRRLGAFKQTESPSWAILGGVASILTMIVALRMFQKQFSAINLLSNSYPLSKGYHKDSHLVTFDQQIADHYPLAIG